MALLSLLLKWLKWDEIWLGITWMKGYKYWHTWLQLPLRNTWSMWKFTSDCTTGSAWRTSDSCDCKDSTPSEGRYGWRMLQPEQRDLQERERERERERKSKKGPTQILLLEFVTCVRNFHSTHILSLLRPENVYPVTRTISLMQQFFFFFISIIFKKGCFYISTIQLP